MALHSRAGAVAELGNDADRVPKENVTDETNALCGKRRGWVATTRRPYEDTSRRKCTSEGSASSIMPLPGTNYWMLVLADVKSSQPCPQRMVEWHGEQTSSMDAQRTE